MIKQQAHQLMALMVLIVIVSAYLLMAFYFPVAYIWATYEDLFGEWGQTYLFAAGCLFALLTAFRRSSHRWFFIVLALALFYTVMEEISWGQRIFEFDSPEVFRRYNLQRETNLHNMLVGPFSTVMKDVIEYALAVGLVLYGFVYPLLLRLGWRPVAFLHEVGIAAPPLYLWPFFVVAAWLELGPFNFNEAEVAEILVGFALAVMAAQYWFAGRHRLNVHMPPPWDPAKSRRFALLIGAVFIAAGVLASTTTYAFFNSPTKRARIESRILNGYEKFADRYQRYDRWDIVADLYLKVHEAEPDRTSVLRRLASAYREQGDEKRFEFYTKKALKITLDIHEENPDKISANLALSRTYKLLGNTRLSRQHGRRAHELALERATAEPESAHWAYWLGKTYRHLGNYEAAREQFKKAFELRPTSTKYRKAYYEMLDATGRGRPIGIR